MKTINLKLLRVTAFLGLATTLFSFAPGGENYVININNKKVIDQYLTRDAELPTLSLNSSLSESEMTVYYNHCGKIGTNRSLSLQNGNQKVKEWKFNGSADKEMHVKVKEILNQLKNDSKSLSLVYYATEIPKGRLLARVEVNSIISSK